jgi:hypothetical protein
MEVYEVYIKTDSDGYIIAVNSSAFLDDTTGWVKIDEGTGDRYHHAQGNYFPLPLITEGGAYRYKLTDGMPVECTAEEIAEQEEALRPEPGTDPGSAESLLADMDTAYREGVDSV